MNPNEKTNQGVQFSFRLEKELSDMIISRAQDEGIKTSAWVRKALAFALENMIEEKETVNKSALVEMLEHDTNFQDLLFEKIAQKLRLNDLKNYLADFALYCRYNSAEEFFNYLKTTSVRLFHLLPDAVNDDGMVPCREIDCTLQWKEKFTWEEFLQLTPAERKAYDFFYLSLGEYDIHPGTGLYFWGRGEDITKLYAADAFDEYETCVVVHAGTLLTDEKKLPSDFINRIVKMVRYAARESKLGPYGNLYDSTLTGYSVINRGYFPPSLPLSFSFFWVSDKWKSDTCTYEELLQAAKDGTDKTLRPVVEPKWQYTDSELKMFKKGEVLPPYVSYTAEMLIGKGEFTTRIYEKTGRPAKLDFVKYDTDEETEAAREDVPDESLEQTPAQKNETTE